MVLASFKRAGKADAAGPLCDPVAETALPHFSSTMQGRPQVLSFLGPFGDLLELGLFCARAWAFRGFVFEIVLQGGFGVEGKETKRASRFSATASAPPQAL